MSTDQNNKETNHLMIWNELNWVPNEKQLAQFIHLQELLKEWNKKTNLTRLIDGDDFWIAQVCDSLLPLHEELQYPELSHKYIDVGSGCGFPGIAIAIAMPNSNITLLDSSSKKTTFLKEVSKEIGLNSRITVVTERAETAGRDPTLRSNFDYAIARAVASADVVAEYLVPFLNSTGQALIFKGDWNEIEQQILKKALTELNAEIQRAYKFVLPNNRGIRNIIRISSINKCPNQYPRSIGKPKKQPLGS
ncbi:16S rRNA (guanine(527)-N(7))-methyltransferase RsmG [Prochlorococcus marinus]|uniref:Ribosomal RNA small subunit methyltransferase G n=1 Tax=Prochlorococcus marinus XMU1408 TaxID=2213228 RepID=A0A318QZD1_PROMR|nr:16S rRNA (guanine(527)-N(7))-methyltransferase RsmG [Prochlorococcus marinus]MBW3042649.1 16S rRNA (guanine(527)-N(7))-methyltransferase RsmG [Prochlorococcus marinus str. XMU1408]PYE01344.1 16S rRNA (guanine(527)-N(7))-methyltransferase RsmG [Prochlorococcus marinus XMU1408]